MTHRGTLLENAHAHTVGDRDTEYGSPFENLGDCGDLWSTYLRRRHGVNLLLSAEDVAHMNILQKMARTFPGHVKDDTYEDMAAYAAIAGECASIAAGDAATSPRAFTAPKPEEEK